MADLTLEIVEGPDAGRRVLLVDTIEIGRDPGVALALADTQASRRHARIRPEAGESAVVEDLGSSNGTFINHSEIVSPTRMGPGDELLIGTSVIQLRSPVQVARQFSAVVAIPQALAASPQRPTYEEPIKDAPAPKKGGGTAGIPELDRLVDARVKSQARSSC